MPSADELLGPSSAEALARAIGTAAPGSPLPSLQAAGDGLQGLALRERADLLRDALLADIPGGYPDLARVVRAAAGSEEFTGWLIWPVTSAVAAKAVEAGQAADAAAFEDALALLAELTPRLTSEFAVRVLLRHDLDRALSVISAWTDSPDEHVRRLASEGTRPYLPWSIRVPEILARPGSTIDLLDALYRDESGYVRRSVANHLNDLSLSLLLIGRDEAALIVGTLTVADYQFLTGTHTQHSHMLRIATAHYCHAAQKIGAGHKKSRHNKALRFTLFCMNYRTFFTCLQ